LKSRYAVFALVFAFLLLIGIQAVEVVDANPFLPISTSPPDNAVLSLKLLSPKENASYTNGTINVCFTKEINSISGVHTSVNPVSTYQGDWMNSSKWCPFPPNQEFQVLQHNFTLTQIPKGYHTLTIDARGGGYYNANGSMYTFELPKKTVTISFFMDTSPVSESQTINQLPSGTPTVPEFPIAGILLVLAIASVSLVYFKRRKKLSS
jgi:hypothetical protein